MSQQTQLQKMGATPGKLALMGVLAAVLVVVIVGQLPSGTENQLAEENLEVASIPADSPAAIAGAAGPADVSARDDRQPKLRAWPEISLTETMANNPFAPPAWATQPELETAESSHEPDRLAEYQKQGASIVVITAGEKSATIGEQKIRVGDILAGYQVADITIEGILVDKLDASQRHGPH